MFLFIKKLISQEISPSEFYFNKFRLKFPLIFLFSREIIRIIDIIMSETASGSPETVPEKANDDLCEKTGVPIFNTFIKIKTKAELKSPCKILESKKPFRVIPMSFETEIIWHQILMLPNPNKNADKYMFLHCLRASVVSRIYLRGESIPLFFKKPIITEKRITYPQIEIILSAQSLTVLQNIFPKFSDLPVKKGRISSFLINGLRINAIIREENI